MAVPIATLVTKPVDAFTLATAVLPELHEPPVVASDKVTEEPRQKPVVPVIAGTMGNGLIVTGYVASTVPHEYDTE